MKEEQLTENVPESENVNSKSNLEGAIVTGRGWAGYESALGIKPEALQNETVLNFGSGGSNIGKQLENKGISCNVVDLDLKFDPDSGFSNPIRYIASLPIKLYLKYFNQNEEERAKIINLKRKILDTKDREFVQGNGRALPFPDKTFDHVLALWSTYQVPKEARETVYKELMRVGNIIHMCPVFKNDYKLLSELAPEQDYEIVACQPVSVIRRLPFKFGSKEEYSSYTEQLDALDRIKAPTKEEATVFTILEDKVATMRGGNSIVLQRKLSSEL